MFYYTTDYNGGTIDIGGPDIIATHQQGGLIYVATLVENDMWAEITETDFLGVRGGLPEVYVSSDERITQLEQVVDTILTGGVSA